MIDFGFNYCCFCTAHLTRTIFWPAVDDLKLFWRNSGKSRYPPKLKQQKYAILKAISSYRVNLLKNALFRHFSAGSDIRTHFFQFLYFGEIQISSKKSFIALTTGRNHNKQQQNLTDENFVLFFPKRLYLGSNPIV